MKAKRIAEITADIIKLKEQISQLSAELNREYGATGAAALIAKAIIARETAKVAMLHAELSAVISTPEKKNSDNDIGQIRESVSDASYALTQIGEDAPHLTLLVKQERLKRLVDLEYALLSGFGEKKKGEQVWQKQAQEGKGSIRNTLTAALNTIQAEHGVCVTGLTAEWIDVSTCEESKKLLTILEIEAEL